MLWRLPSKLALNGVKVMIPEAVLGAGAKGFAGALAKLAVEHAARSLTGSNNPEKVRTDIAPHIEATYQRCSTIKTLLNPHQPADFLSIYATQRFSLGKQRLDQYALVDLIRNSENHVVITGTGGMGKSMFMRYLWLSLFVHADGRVPLFLELRSMNTISQNDLLQYVFHTLSSGQARISQKDFAKRLAGGDFVILLDGFDELASDRRDIVQKAVIDLSHNFPKLKVVVSSRPDEARFSSWSSFKVVSAEPLEKNDLVELVNKAEFDQSSKKNFLRKVKDTEFYQRHQSFLANPLLASMMLLTFSYNFDIPDTTHLFYEQAFDALFQRHDSHKPGGYKREFRTTLSEFEFKRLLSYLCLLTYFESKYEFSRDDLLRYVDRAIKFEKFNARAEDFLHDIDKCVCMIIPDGLVYTFPHRSFQEYFAAFCLSYVTQNRFRDIVTTLGRRGSDQAVKMVSDMNPELFRNEFIIPVAEGYSEVLQIGAKTKQVDVFMRDSGLTFTYHIQGDDEDNFFVILNESSPCFDFASILQKLYMDELPQSRIDHHMKDAEALKLFLALLTRKNVMSIRIEGSANGYRFHVTQRNGKQFVPRKNLDELSAAFMKSGMYTWVLERLRAASTVVQRERSKGIAAEGAMDELFKV